MFPSHYFSSSAVIHLPLFLILLLLQLARVLPCACNGDPAFDALWAAPVLVKCGPPSPTERAERRSRGRPKYSSLLLLVSHCNNTIIIAIILDNSTYISCSHHVTTAALLSSISHYLSLFSGCNLQACCHAREQRRPSF